MTDQNDDPRARLRWNVYLLLIFLGTGAMLGRILAVDSVDQTAVQEYLIRKRVSDKSKALAAKGVKGRKLDDALKREEARLRGLIRMQRPFLSANDRSRWCAVRALVEEQMRVTEEFPTPLLFTLISLAPYQPMYPQVLASLDLRVKIAVPYAIDKVIEQPTWDTIDMVKHDGHLYSSKPPLFPTLLAAEYWLIHRLTGATLGTHPYAIGRFMLITANVIPLIICFLLLARLVERFGTTDWGRMFVMGAAAFGTFLTTFAVVINNHLPAAVSALIAVYAAVRIWFDNERRWWYFVVAGLFAAFAAANELPALALFAALSLALLWKAPWRTMLAYVPAVLVVAAGFFTTNWIAHGSLKPPYMHRGGGGPDDWYDYTYQRNGRQYESYWNRPAGIDRGEESPAVYALHVLVGHHGIFSLTPVWLLSVAGAVMWMWKGTDRRLRELALLIAAVTLVCLAFYLTRPLIYRNYGGMTSGLRWMFWFAPMWLLLTLPAADGMSARWWTRGIALILLVISVFSAVYPVWNPWTHPWLANYLHHLEWIKL